MPWRIKTMKEERQKFILEASTSQSKTFKDLCFDYNISPKTGYKWYGRYLEQGEEGLKEISRAPKTNPLAIAIEVRECIISIKQEFGKWGAKKIRTEMQQNYPHLKVPSEGSIFNILKEKGLVKDRIYRRHVAMTAPLQECLAPNDVWMYDFKGWFKTANGAKCEPLTVTDGFSRYLLVCKHMTRKRSSDVWEVLERVFYEYGLPARIRSDNGPPFASLGVGRLSPLSIKLIKAGITPEWIEPGCPEQNGRHERFHLTLKNETALPPALTLNLQQEKFDQFKNYYNHRRYHEALGQKTPHTIYKTSTRPWNGKLKSPEYSNEFEVRKVSDPGCISWRGKDFFISESLIKEYVALKEVELGIMNVYYGPILLGKIDHKGFKRL